MESSEWLIPLQSAVKSSSENLQKYFKNVATALEKAHEEAAKKVLLKMMPLVNAVYRISEKILDQLILSLASSKERHFIKCAKKQRIRQKYRNRVWRRFLNQCADLWTISRKRQR